MRKVLLVLCLVLLATCSVYASDWKVSVRGYQTIPTDSVGIVQSGTGVQANLYYKLVYLYLSQDRVPVRFSGQRGDDLTISSLGFGVERELVDGLILFCDMGWYEPTFSLEGKDLKLWGEPLSEGLNIYLNQHVDSRLGYYEWDFYSLEYAGSIGGKIGLSFQYPLTSKFLAGFTVGFQYLRFHEDVKGRDYGPYRGHWEWREDRDFSNYQMGIVLTYQF